MQLSFYDAYAINKLDSTLRDAIHIKVITETIRVCVE